MRKMKEMKKFLLVGMMLLTGSTMMSAEENNVTNEVDTTYIKLDENREPINHVNLTYDELVDYNKILNALAQSNSIKDTHNTGGNYYQYANFQVQFDDFEGYEKLTFSVIPADLGE